MKKDLDLPLAKNALLNFKKEYICDYLNVVKIITFKLMSMIILYIYINNNKILNIQRHFHPKTIEVEVKSRCFYQHI